MLYQKSLMMVFSFEGLLFFQIVTIYAFKYVHAQVNYNILSKVIAWLIKIMLLFQELNLRVILYLRNHIKESILFYLKIY